jgi:hypothetical protein
MSRKSTIITLGVLGAVAATGLGMCCCGGLMNEEKDEVVRDKDGQQHIVRHTPRSPRLHFFAPLFGGGPAARTYAPTGTGHPSGSHPSSTPRGGFGGTGGGAHGGGVGA